MLDATTIWGRLAHVGVPILGGAIFYLGFAYAMRFEEVEQIRRIWTTGREKR